jgi:hypothetical protein
VHDPRARFLRACVTAVDRVADEERLAREVDVVGAGFRARLDQGHAVLAVRADGRRNDAAAFRQRL